MKPFLEPATWIPEGLFTPTSIEGVFDEEPVEVDPATGVSVRSGRPRLSVRLSTLPGSPEKGDVVEVRAATYDVVDVEPDGQGVADLVLQLKT